MEMGPDSGLRFAKPETRKKVKAQKREVYADVVARIRVFVFGRERGICRCCRLRSAESMHELQPRSVGGRVSKKNSVAVCGDGVQGCHGLLQRHEIWWDGDARGAQGTLTFQPRTPRAADWIKVRQHQRVESPIMHEIAESGA